MFNKKEIMLWMFVLVVSIMVAWSCRLDAAEVKEEVKISDKYPNFLLYNSTAGCFRGVAQIMVMLNPHLANIPMPPAIQQQILAHCSCIMDKIRAKHSIQEYNNKINDFLWIKKLWGKLGAESTK